MDLRKRRGRRPTMTSSTVGTPRRGQDKDETTPLSRNITIPLPAKEKGAVLSSGPMVPFISWLPIRAGSQNEDAFPADAVDAPSESNDSKGYSTGETVSTASGAHKIWAYVLGGVIGYVFSRVTAPSGIKNILFVYEMVSKKVLGRVAPYLGHDQTLTRSETNDPLEGYEVINRERVEKLLQQWPTLGKQLIELREAAPQYFPNKRQILVRIMWDEPTCLVARIVTDSPLALAQLQKFRSEREDSLHDSSDGYLYISVASS